MEIKLLTQLEFFNMPQDDIPKEDKILIEKAVIDCGGSAAESPDKLIRQAIRGFLAKQYLDLEVDDKWREEAGIAAATFSDGWSWCEQFGK